MSNLLQEASSRGGGAIAHLVETHPKLYQHVKVGALNLRHHAAHVQHRQRQTSTIDPPNQPTTALTSGGFSDFVLNGGEVVKGMTLELNLVAAANVVTSTATDLESVIGCISHIEIFANGSSLAISRITADDLLVKFAEFPTTKYERLQRAVIGATPGAATADLVANETRTCYVPLLRNFVVDNELFTSGVSSPLVFKVWWNRLSVLGAANVSIASTRILVDNFRYDNSIRQRMQNTYMSGPKQDFRFMAPSNQTTSENIIPNNRHNIRLSGVVGLITKFTVIVQVTGEAAPRYLTKLELMDAGGSNVLGGATVSHTYMADILGSDDNSHFVDPGGTPLVSDAYYRLPIGENESASDDLGAISGYISMSGTHQIGIWLEGTETTAQACTVKVLYSAANVFSIDRGVCSVTRS